MGPPGEVESEVSSLMLFRRRQEDVPQIIARDAERVRQHAAVVLEVLPDGVREHFNPRPSLNVLAVIGPGQSGQTHFSDAVLLEVGLGKGIPYHEACNGRWHGARYPLCHLSHKDYARLSARIFQILQQRANSMVLGRKCGPSNPFFLKMNRVRFYKKSGLNEESGLRPVPAGVRFSVARRDRHLLADAYWLQFHGRDPHLAFARFIDKIMSQYKNERLFFERRKDVAWLIEELKARCPKKGRRTWQPYMLVELLSAQLFRGVYRKIRFNYQLAEIVARITGWSGGETQERKLIRTVCSGPEERLAGIQLRDISGLRPQDAHKDHVVFEIFYRSERKEASIA